MQLVKRIAASRVSSAAVVALLGAVAIAAGVKAFGVTVTGGVALYFVVWWTLLFAALPFGVRSQAEEGDVVAGSEPGAPAMPRLAEKAIWTTVAADAVFLGALAILPLAGL
jgi:predicted secreted protein